MDRSETYRILSIYQKRLKLANFLHSKKWSASFEDCKQALGWVDYQLYMNVLRSRKLPTVPRIRSAIIPLAKSDQNFCTLSHTDSMVILENFALWDQRADLIFTIPSKIARLHPNLSKISRPSVRLLNGEVVFDFTFRESVASERIISSSTLALDLGVSKAFSAARVYSDGRYSEELVTSVFTERQSKTAKKLSQEIKMLSDKNKRRAILGVHNSQAVKQEKILREKRIRVNEAQDWSVAADIISHSKSGEQITIENLKFNSGSVGSIRFRHSSVSSKLEHAANRLGKNVKRVNASYSSQTCPQCQKRVTPNTNRMTRCICGWIEDRDYTAAIVLGQRALKIKKLSIKKNRPTPKRPRNSARKARVLKKKNTVWTAFTGAYPTEATGLSLARTATSVIGVTPVSCSSNLAA
jgi:transposase